MATSLEFWLFLPRCASRWISSRSGPSTQRRRASPASPAWTTWHHRWPRARPCSTPWWPTRGWPPRPRHLRVGSLVLCDSFRHPVVLAREAVTLDHASGGRFELGIGWGSVAAEFETFGIGSHGGHGCAWAGSRSRSRSSRRSGAARRRLRGGALHPSRCPAAARAPENASRRHRGRRPQDDGAGGRLRGLVERPHRHPRQARRDAAAGRAARAARCRCRSRSSPSEDRREEVDGLGAPQVRKDGTRRRDGAGARRLLRVPGRARRRARLRLVHRLRPARDAGGVRQAVVRPLGRGSKLG